MALALFDRVQETTTTTGTGAVTLAGAVSGFQSFAVVGNGNTCYYTILDGTAWEVGIGTYSSVGPSLARTTVLSNSSGTTSPLTLTAGTKTVFLTYPAEKSVNLDASGNVSPLGTVSSGVWQGTTVGVAYGGTGVTTSSGANSVMLRDSNQNISVNSVTQARAIVTSAAGTTTLTPASAHFQILVGTAVQTFKLPDATTLANGSSWVFDNDSTGNLTVTDNAGATIDVVAPGGYTTVFVESNATVGGEWGRFGMLPAEVNWGTNSLDLGGSTIITNGVWNGTPIAYNYGGTGLTTFVGANKALYSTSASALTAGTLPVAAGGTGLTTLTSTGVLFANSTSSFNTSANLTYNGSDFSVLGGNIVTDFAFLGRNGAGLTLYNVGNTAYGILGFSSTLGIYTTSDFTVYNGKNLQLWNSGNSAKALLAFDGTYVTSDKNLLLSAGTINGVAYLNGSKILTTGTGLVFDGTNLGVGATSPAAKLQISSGSGGDSTGLRITRTDAGGGDFRIWTTATVNGEGAGKLIFSNASNLMTLDASGNLGVGATSPFTQGTNPRSVEISGLGYGQLYVTATGSSTRGALMAVSGDSVYLASITNHPLRFGTSDTERARIDSSGNLLVGTPSGVSGVARVQVLGAALASAMNIQVGTNGYPAINFNNASSTQQGYIQTNASTVLYVSVSDYRLKNTVAPMTGALAKVALLKPCTYKWNATGSNGQGFIAHELAEVCPDAVTGEKDAVDADGNPQYQGIDTSFLVATLTAAIQELKAEFDAYKAAHP